VEKKKKKPIPHKQGRGQNSNDPKKKGVHTPTMKSPTERPKKPVREKERGFVLR